MNKKGSLGAIAIIITIIIIVGFFLSGEAEPINVKEKATAFVQKCESRNYTICEYYHYGGFSGEEFINEVEKEGWKLKTVAGRYADHFYFERMEK